MLYGDLVILVLFLASKLYYEKVQANIITLLFFMITYMICQVAVLFSIRFCEMSHRITKLYVKIKQLNVTILKSGVRFKWSSSVREQ